METSEIRQRIEKIDEDLKMVLEQIGHLKERIARLEGNHDAIYGS